MAHVYYLTDARDLVQAGVDGFLHLVRDEEMDDGLVQMMKDKRVFVTPNSAPARQAPTPGSQPGSTIRLLAETATAAEIKKVADVYAARETAARGGAATPRPAASRMPGSSGAWRS